MRSLISKPMIPALLIAGLGLSACGSSGSAKHPASRGPGHPLRTYHVQLSGKEANPHGAAGGVGAAVIALHHRAVICFRFAHLHGFSGITTAALGQAAKGQKGKVVLALSRSNRFHHSGCVRAPHALPTAIERNPSSYYVAIDSKQYPQGAVRGQL